MFPQYDPVCVLSESPFFLRTKEGKLVITLWKLQWGGKIYARNFKMSQYSQHDYLNKLLCQTKSNYFFPKASFREYFHLKFVMFHFSITIVFFLLPVKILFYKSIGWVNSAVLLKGPLLAFRFSTNDSINMMSPLN